MTRWCALAVAVVTAIITASSVLSLVDAERTGVVHYSENPTSPDTERVARSDSPERFDEAINITAFHTMLPLAIMVTSIWFYRRLSR